MTNMKGKGSRIVRYTVQIGFLAFLTYIGYMHQQLGGGPNGMPPVDALCPLGGAESMYSYLKSGIWLRRTAPSAMVLFVSVALMTVLLGRVFCGWICPLGTIGQLSASLGRKIGIKKIELPERKTDRVMRLGKYVVLAIAVLGSWYYGTLLWRGYDPWVAWMHISAGWAEVEEAPWAFGILFFVVIGGVHGDRALLVSLSVSPWGIAVVVPKGQHSEDKKEGIQLRPLPQMRRFLPHGP